MDEMGGVCVNIQVRRFQKPKVRLNKLINKGY